MHLDPVELRRYLDASPSPFHAVATSAALLTAAGFEELDERAPWSDDGAVVVPAGFVVREGALIAWRRPTGALDGARIVGAHTDSPGLRVKPHPELSQAGWRQLGVEVYGGVLLNSWLDRDLGLAGRVIGRDGSSRLVRTDGPVARVPQLAIHLDRDVNERGLVLNRQAHLAPVWATDGAPAFTDWLAEVAGVVPAWWELCLFDVQPAAVLGADTSMLASGRIDNLVSCWAATTALVEAEATDSLAVIALFDHEEVGSASTTGASGPFLEAVLERVHTGTRAELQRFLAASSCVSADGAHAAHPNYLERHDPAHAPRVNGGPAVKVNVNQRYATSAATAHEFEQACRRVGVPVQTFVSRNDVPCGSTIGPLTATRLGIPTVDVGVPQLSMHSAREVCGVDDPPYLAAALASYLSG